MCLAAKRASECMRPEPPRAACNKSMGLGAQEPSRGCSRLPFTDRSRAVPAGSIRLVC